MNIKEKYEILIGFCDTKNELLYSMEDVVKWIYNKRRIDENSWVYTVSRRNIYIINVIFMV